MAKFVNGSGVLSTLTDIITNAERKLLLISPYLNIPVQTKNYLKSTDKKGIPITIIYRTNEKLTNPDLYFLKNLKNLTLGHCENLHSKCYINENEGLITSMNLYEHSLTHNWEMGLRFSRQEDHLVYEDVSKEIQNLKSQTLNHIYLKETGYCIRCRAPMGEINPDKPLCKKCFREWAKYKRSQHPERYCHFCGSDTTNSLISFGKPLCKDCTDILQKNDNSHPQ